MTAGSASLRWSERWPIGHVAIIAMALIVVWMAIGFNLWSERRSAMDHATTDTTNLARAFVESTIRTLENVNRTLETVGDDYAGDGSHFDLKAWADTHAKMKNLPFDLAIVDPDGRIVQATGGSVTHDANATDPQVLRSAAKKRNKPDWRSARRYQKQRTSKGLTIVAARWNQTHRTGRPVSWVGRWFSQRQGYVSLL